MTPAAPTLPHAMKVLADPTRLRLLGLLAAEELSVSELARATAMSQSRVSNHLKLLRDAHMLDQRKEGPSVLVRLARREPMIDELWSAVEPRLESVEGRDGDVARLGRVLDARRRRSRDFFDRVAPEWDRVGSEFERGVVQWRAIGGLVPDGLVVADVGCGTGFMARALVHVASRVVCIDHSSAMLAKARRHLAAHKKRVEFRRGEVDRLPLADGEVDAVFASLVLHHVPDVFAALREMRRAIRPGGTLVVTDLAPHHETWMSEAMADLRLGLDPTELQQRATKAGFVDATVAPVEDRYVVEGADGRKAELELFLLQARVPHASANGDRPS
jgi:ArsR family transcriptional regulator